MQRQDSKLCLYLRWDKNNYQKLY